MKLHFRISLRASILLFCITCCTVAYLADVKRRQVKVKRIVSDLGGFVANVDFEDARCINPSRISFLPEFLYTFLPEHCNYVYAPFPEVDDDKLVQILSLPGIEGLNISWSSITNKSLLELRKKRGLREIQLYDIPTITEEAILQFEKVMCCEIQYK
jgi:hypothetical protein